jgi:hypothetical protein
MEKLFKFKIMDTEVKKPEGWPYLEFNILLEDEGMGLYEKSAMLIDYEQVEIMYFYQSSVRLQKGDPVEVTTIRLSDEQLYKVVMKYAKFKKLMIEWFDYYNYLNASDVFEVKLEENDLKVDASSKQEPIN